jgi:flagellin-like hook-associated protein FlgL
MISNLSASSEAFLASTRRIHQRLEVAGRETSSGKRVNVAADAPSQIDTILQLRTNAVRNTQIQENLSVANPSFAVDGFGGG